MLTRTRTSTLFPYTTLFRSPTEEQLGIEADHVLQAIDPPVPPGQADEVHRSRQSHVFTAEQGQEGVAQPPRQRSEEHTSELQSRQYLVCRLLLEKKKKK